MPVASFSATTYALVNPESKASCCYRLITFMYVRWFQLFRPSRGHISITPLDFLNIHSLTSECDTPKPATMTDVTAVPSSLDAFRQLKIKMYRMTHVKVTSTCFCFFFTIERQLGWGH